MTTTSETPRHQITIAFLLVLVLAAAMRITAAMNTVVDTPIRSDAQGYVAYSYNLKNSGIYSRQVTWIPGDKPERVVPDALQQPGYPAFLRLFLGDTPDAAFVRSVMFAQACIGVVTVALAFVLTRLALGSLAALFVMLLVAISPHLIVMENYVLSETLFTLLVVVAIGAGTIAMRYRDSAKGMAAAAATGGALGLCCLVRPPLTQLALLVTVATILIPPLRGYRRQALVGMICFMLVMAPWWIRNLYEFGHMADSTSMINTLLHGSYPDFLYNGDPKTLGYPYRFDPRMGEIGQSVGTALAEIQRKFANEPMTYLEWYLLGKVKFFFNWQIVDGFYDVFTYPVLKSPYFGNTVFVFTHALMRGLHWPLMIAGLLGGVLAWTKRAEIVVAGWKLHALRWQSLVLANILLANMVGAPYPRYSIPFRPLLYLLALFSILVCAAWVRDHREHARRGA